MEISRPVLTIVPTLTGKAFRWEATADSWEIDMISTAHFPSAAKAEAHGKRMLKAFDAQAKKLEDPKYDGPHRWLIEELKDHRIITIRSKLCDDFAELRV